jgi:tetratricopeptide (TPR) repeat protein
MPDQTPLSPKIEDLKARVRLDPKSRLFVPLAEEYRKIGRAEEAEAVLRSGLEHHSGYLSAWISLGRCLIERGARTDATGALMNALSIDPGNVVAARMLADNYLALGEKVEAIKKLKLVRALLPSDSSVEEAIASLERELGQAPPVSPRADAVEPAPESPATSSQPASDDEFSGAPLLQAEPPEPGPQQTGGEERAEAAESRPEPSGPSEMQVAASVPFFLQGDEQDEEPAAAPDERMEAPEPSPFEGTEASPASDPTYGFVQQREETSSSATPEEEPAPFEAERTEAFPKELPAADGESDEGEEDLRGDAQVDAEISTLTMADLYARQGHAEAARDIYVRMLERDPSNEEVRRKLDLLGDSPAAAVSTPAARREDAVRKLESWLQKVGPR